MKIEEIIISEDTDAGAISSSAFATAPPGNLFAVPMKRYMSMIRKREKRESKELLDKTFKSNVIEDKQ